MKDIAQYTREPARMLLDMAGEDVTLVTQVVDYYDDYNDPVYERTELETKAEIVVRGTPTFERRIDGVDSNVTAVAWIMDDIAPGYGETYGEDYGGSFQLSTGNESESQGATTVETDTHEFELYEWFDENNGKHRLHLE
jgi:hypothetical protein